MRRGIVVLLVGACVVGGVAYWWRPAPTPVAAPRLVWVFEAPEPGGFVAAPTVSDSMIYAAAMHVRGFRRHGAVYTLDPATGKPRWTFDDDLTMRPTASEPLLRDGRLFIGEGMHADFVCRMRCLDAATGAKAWDFETAGHIESTAAIDGDTVFVTAGDDGVHALDRVSGKPRWHFAADVHIDATPHIADGRVYVGTGPSRRFPSLQVLCLDAKNGAPLWRVPTRLPAWGSPTVRDGRVFVGLGNGRLTEGAKPPETPAGELLCLDAKTGETRWSFPTPDAVFQRPTLHDDRVLFGSRDGHVYAVRIDDGLELFRVPMGGPVIAPPTIDGERVYVISTSGLLKCFDPRDGHEHWSFDLRARVRAEVLVFAQVRVAGNRLYVAAESTTGAGPVAALYCLEP